MYRQVNFQTPFLLCVLCVSVVHLLANREAAAQSRQVPAPPQAETVVLMAATIHPVTGPVIDDGYIIFDKGVITAMGAGPRRSLGCREGWSACASI
jgi:hypothetical protein